MGPNTGEFPAQSGAPSAGALAINFTLPGALSGVLFFLLINHSEASQSTSLRLATMTAIAAGSVSYWMLTREGARVRALAIAIALALGFGLLLGQNSDLTSMISYRGRQDANSLAIYCVGGFLVIALPFIRLFTEPRVGHSLYSALFFHSWEQAVAVVCGGMFALLSFLLLALIVVLLDMTGLSFKNLVFTEALLTPLLLAAASTAVGVLRVRVVMLKGLHHIAMILLRLLMPVHLIAMAIFLTAVAVRGIDTSVSGIGVVALSMSIAAALTFISAVLGDSEQLNMPRWQLLACRSLALLTLPLSLLAANALWIRIDTYGLTGERVLAVCVVTISVLYGTGYSIVGLLPAFDKYIRRVNIVVALVVACVCLLLLTPVLNPDRLAVADQMRRFDNGTTAAEKIDLSYLKFQAGSAGVEALQEVLPQVAKSPAAQREPLKTRLIKIENTSTLGQYRRYDWVHREPENVPSTSEVENDDFFPNSIRISQALVNDKLSVTTHLNGAIRQANDLVSVSNDKDTSKVIALLERLSVESQFSQRCTGTDVVARRCALLVTDEASALNVVQKGEDADINTAEFAAIALLVMEERLLEYIQLAWIVLDVKSGSAEQWRILPLDTLNNNAAINVPNNDVNALRSLLAIGKLPAVERVQVNALRLGDSLVLPGSALPIQR